MASAQNKNKIFAELAKNASTISNRQENSRKKLFVSKPNVGLSLDASL